MTHAQRFDIETEADIVEMRLVDRADEYRAKRRATFAYAAAVHADAVENFRVALFDAIARGLDAVWAHARRTLTRP